MGRPPAPPPGYGEKKHFSTCDLQHLNSENYSKG